MVKTITAIERDGFNVRIMNAQFEVPDENFDLMAAIEKVADAYCKTEGGQRTLNYNCGCFNLADFVSSVPEYLCQLYGFKLVDDVVNDIEIDWDRQLADVEVMEHDGEDVLYYREYVLTECERQWAACQEEEAGPWSEQSEETRKAYFTSMYTHLWDDRFEPDCVIVPDQFEKDAWEKLNA